MGSKARQKRAAAIRHAIDQVVPASTPDHDAAAASPLLQVLAPDERGCTWQALGQHSDGISGLQLGGAEGKGE